MKTKHTKGPWEAGKTHSQDKNSWYAVVFSPAKTGIFHTPRAAEAFGVTKEEAESNAHLIAAAPELLEACQLAVATIERLNRHDSANGTLDVLQEAIAKATA